MKKAQKLDKAVGQMHGQSLQLLGIRLNSTSLESVLNLIVEKIASDKKLWLVTPNPEFLVAAQQDEEFKRRLNQADLAIPDGVGLLLASWFLGTKPRLAKRVAGADVVERILVIAGQRGWNIGVVGARRGERQEIETLIKNLKLKIENLHIEAQELTPGWEKKKHDIVFACQGMGEQERWIEQNWQKAQAKIFVGVGGSLDFFSGFAARAPVWIRRMGLEWFWRLVSQPWRWRRQVNLLKFVWLVLKERFG